MKTCLYCTRPPRPNRKTCEFCAEVGKKATQKWRAANRERFLSSVKDWRRRTMSTPQGHVSVLLVDAKRRAKQGGIEFSAVIEDLLPLPEFCPVFGVRLEYGQKGGYSPASPSIDRIDSSRGYVRGNVWVISKRANTIKSDATPYELLRVAEATQARLS